MNDPEKPGNTCGRSSARNVAGGIVGQLYHIASVEYWCGDLCRKVAWTGFAGSRPSRYHAAMQWLLHGPMTSAVPEALRRHGHTAHDLAEAGLPPEAPLADVLMIGRQKQWDILTTSQALVEAVYELDFWLNRSMVLLQLDDGGDVEQDDAIDRLFARYKRLTPGRLYTVTNSRVKVRQLPSRGLSSSAKGIMRSRDKQTKGHREKES
jgi:hypothetical protein